MNDNLASKSTEIRNLGTEEEQDTNLRSTLKPVTDQDIFKLGKTILMICAMLFVIVAALKMLGDPSHSQAVNDVWEFSKIVLNSITSLVLGLYFGRKTQ